MQNLHQEADLAFPWPPPTCSSSFVSACHNTTTTSLLDNICARLATMHEEHSKNASAYKEAVKTMIAHTNAFCEQHCKHRLHKAEQTSQETAPHVLVELCATILPAPPVQTVTPPPPLIRLMSVYATE
eukprot:8541487-Ditylum_brightwellii.AAC.1